MKEIRELLSGQDDVLHTAIGAREAGTRAAQRSYSQLTSLLLLQKVSDKTRNKNSQDLYGYVWMFMYSVILIQEKKWFNRKKIVF